MDSRNAHTNSILNLTQLSRMVWMVEEEVAVSANYITNERGKWKADKQTHSYDHIHTVERKQKTLTLSAVCSLRM